MIQPEHLVRADRQVRGFAGLGLLAILLALAIGLYVMFVATSHKGGKTYMETVRDTKKEGEDLAMAIQARDLATNVLMYKMSNNDELPKSFEDLGLNGSNYPDRWGDPMRFRIDGDRTVVLISNGPDGRPDTEDDIEATAQLQF